MKLSSFEAYAMRSSVRRWVMDRVDAPLLFRGTAPGQFRNVLELGCGPGYGTSAVIRHIAPEALVVTDFDPDMVRRAQEYVPRRHPTQKMSFQQASATDLPFPDGHFDAVVAFAILHHIKDYEQAVREIARVLKKGGTAFLEEVGEEIHFWPINRLMVPEVMFKDGEVVALLERHGFTVAWKGRYLKAYMFLECKKLG